MKRRNVCQVLALLPVAMSLPLAAQTAPPLRVAWATMDGAASGAPMLTAFRGGMAEQGYVEGRNYVVENWWGDGSAARLEQLARDGSGARPDVIVAHSGLALGPVLRSGVTTPVIFGMSADPVEAKIVASYARPGGHVTGITLFATDLFGKRIEMLKEFMPRVKRIAIIANPWHPGEHKELKAAREAAATMGIDVRYFPTKDVAELDAALTEIAGSRIEAMLIFSDGFAQAQSVRIAEFSVAKGIPAVGGWADFARRGYLLTYGPSFSAVYRRLAAYAVRIHKGAKPGDLPIEQPVVLELVVNQKTAKALGLTVPTSLLARADTVIR